MRKAYSSIKNKKEVRRAKRRLTIRAKLSGSAERPRICPHKANANISVQVIDDTVGSTLASISTFGKNKVGEGCNRESAKLLGKSLAAKLISANIKAAVFDRAGYKYTGVISSLVEGIREGGISI